MRFILDLDAWNAGYAAGAAGQPLNSCPYVPSSREAWSWNAGFIEGKASRKQSA